MANETKSAEAPKVVEAPTPTPTPPGPKTFPSLHLHEIAVLTAAAVNYGATKVAIANAAATSLNDPHFEPSVRVATIDKLTSSKFLSEGGGSYVLTEDGKQALRRSIDLAGKLLNVLQVTGALR